MKEKRQFSSRSLVLIVICVAINMIAGQMISMLKLPLFLDSIGTVLCAVLAGPWVALFTGNVLWGLLTGPIAAAFAPVSMVIGCVAGVMARAGWFKSFGRVVITGVVITLCLTVVAVPIRTYLFGGATGSGADFVVAYLHAVGEGLQESVAFTVVGVNLIDKILTVLIVWVLLRRMPERTRHNFPHMAPIR